jgi:hypothetical protein
MDGVVEVPLSKGKMALVDADDWERLSRYKWYAWKNPSSGRFYAKSTFWIPGEKKSVSIMMHSLIVMGIGADTDHANTNSLDNRKLNLRPASRSQNNANKAPIGERQFKGIYFWAARQKWVSGITANGKRRTLGYFDTPEDAAKCYDNAAREAFGEFARLNFPQVVNGN